MGRRSSFLPAALSVVYSATWRPRVAAAAQLCVSVRAAAAVHMASSSLFIVCWVVSARSPRWFARAAEIWLQLPAAPRPRSGPRPASPMGSNAPTNQATRY